MTPLKFKEIPSKTSPTGSIFINDIQPVIALEEIEELPKEKEKPSFEERVQKAYEETFKTSNKEGVSELFESNPKLANQIYEALGVTGNISDEQKQQQIADIEKRRQEELEKINKRLEKLNQKEDRRVKIETYRTLNINDEPVEVEITTNADGSRVLKAREINEDGSVEPMAYAIERINSKAQLSLTNEKLVEGYIGNEGNTLKELS